MDKNALNIPTDQIKERKELHNYNYDFLSNNLKMNDQKYYQLIQSIETFKLKNVYNFLVLRSLKLHDKFSTKKMKLNKYIQNPEELNKELSEYIQNDKFYSVIIMNGIQQYFIPMMNQ